MNSRITLLLLFFVKKKKLIIIFLKKELPVWDHHRTRVPVYSLT